MQMDATTRQRPDMQELTGEWIIGSKPRPYDDINAFQVWLDDGSVRRARRVGNWSTALNPGTLCFTDCTHPLANVICHEPRIRAWRIDLPPSQR